jgi:hypothetical protein
MSGPEFAAPIEKDFKEVALGFAMRRSHVGDETRLSLLGKAIVVKQCRSGLKSYRTASLPLPTAFNETSSHAH